MITRIKNLINEYPGKFWLLAASSFIDSLGKTILFPFFTLYITAKFNVGMTEAGILLAIFSVMGMVGSTIGGALADKMGRKLMILLGLILSALSSLVMGFIDQLAVFYFAAFWVGLLADIGHPARQAMIADLLPEEQRADGFGVFRVIHNLAWIVGPSIGGFLAAKSYMSLFISDAVLSTITALIVMKYISETRPEKSEVSENIGLIETFRGYLIVLKNTVFISFLGVVVLMVFVYQQLYSSLSVYLRDVHGVSESGYGILMSLNAFIVVLFQFWVTRRIKNRNPYLMMAFGTIFYLVGYSMFGFVHGYLFFIVAALFITVGEMITIPVQQAHVARIAPEDMRGRYMAISGFSYALPSTVGPWVAGLIMDNYNPDYLWYVCGIVSVLAIIGFLTLYSVTGRRPAGDKVQNRK